MNPCRCRCAAADSRPMSHAAAPSGLDGRPLAPIALRQSPPSGRKNAHRGLAACRRTASGQPCSQVLTASGKNRRSPTTARRSHLLQQSNPQSGHHYSIKTSTFCSASDTFNSLKAPDVSAPGAPAAQEGTHELNLTGGNPILQTVNTPAMTIVNTTLPGHVFYPGTVTISVTPAPDGSVIQITGTGTGADPLFNDIVGNLFFGGTAALIQNGCALEAGAPYFGGD